MYIGFIYPNFIFNLWIATVLDDYNASILENINYFNTNTVVEQLQKQRFEEKL